MSGDELRLVNVGNGVSHGARPDGRTTLCAINTARSNTEYDLEYGEFGDMKCGRCRSALDRACRVLLRELLR